MPRIRTIKPEFGSNEELSALPAEAHLLAGLLLTYADDEGYFNAHPKLVQANTCPLRELSEDIPTILRRLAGIGYLELCAGTDGKSYARICNFKKHQWLSHPKPSKIAQYWKPPENSNQIPDGSGEEGKGKGKELEREGIPEEQQPPLNCARRLMEILGLPQTGNFLRTVEAAITAESSYLSMEPADAAQLISDKAGSDRKRGIALDKFYFEDAKWRNQNGANQKPSAAAARADRVHDAVATGIGADLGRRTQNNSTEREDRPRRALSS